MKDFPDKITEQPSRYDHLEQMLDHQRDDHRGKPFICEWLILR